ncbi:MAG: hypothetical protein UX85_C0003G0010 [Candidatus Beckwithbacteria bacterium GW2011_GWB1_47_15]|uniref:Uncharacterized protein n=1 Tax=Candidatus Beckwithbacteria bacterium GW2011_GWB1_47_15 TaxID=1618371 RepID=A0A0G1RW50_9BACT|nr:MAG: hypothetical protein UY43_C0001G0456 [Candidatus Beckwithbacteria bacterium GW2011_GWC1_49_16]KKU34940.1 MAG: hypothetical protein UX50_C0008G0016 [Candidatus Beckwithbacteria bacterium GW2011_GWA1_46_30]KKU61351.1 MAG: hypothetical protein UX85_C0003G0010 [Candidatus Beckwithbacteria bacterium GW2011_GWB1_47_15]KKU71378.1 MAG: hypothetical protein UX97_C0007G0016 [Candidatus Beckwithbacteria bacterium GW2011_GWA2_47_25]OGD48706.1 MAG: hypothetical protein A2877_03465 [Candidatus Beckwi
MEVNPRLKFAAKKLIAVSLIVSPLVQIYLSFRDILFVLPKIQTLVSPANTQVIYIDLFNKAIIISTGLFIDSFYGFSLLLKPLEATRYLHLVFGVLLLAASILIYRSTVLTDVLSHLYYLPLT